MTSSTPQRAPASCGGGAPARPRAECAPHCQCVRTRTYMHAHSETCTYTHTCMHKCTPATQTHIIHTCTSISTHMHTQARIMHAHMHQKKPIYMQVHAPHTCTYTCTHTHTQMPCSHIHPPTFRGIHLHVHTCAYTHLLFFCATLPLGRGAGLEMSRCPFYTS